MSEQVIAERMYMPKPTLKPVRYFGASAVMKTLDEMNAPQFPTAITIPKATVRLYPESTLMANQTTVMGMTMYAPAVTKNIPA